MYIKSILRYDIFVKIATILNNKTNVSHEFRLLCLDDGSIEKEKN